MRSWFIYSSVSRRLDKIECNRKKHIKHLASRMNKLELLSDTIIAMEEKVTKDAEINESVIRTYEESLETERSKLRIAEDMISNQVLRNDRLREQYREDIAASVKNQITIPPERVE